jgi:hypothetical protein
VEAIQVIHLLGRVDLFASVDHHAGTHTSNCGIVTPCGEFSLSLLSTPCVAGELEDEDFFHSGSSITIGLEAELFLGWLLLLVLDWRRRVKEKSLQRRNEGEDVGIGERWRVGEDTIDFQIHLIIKDSHLNTE